MEYFKSQWYQRHPNWFVGASPAGFVNTNNGTESFNAKIKKVYTFRSKLPAGEFLNTFTNLFKDESLKYQNENLIKWYPTQFLPIDLKLAAKSFYEQPFEETNSLNFKICSSTFSNITQVSPLFHFQIFPSFKSLIFLSIILSL